MRTLFAFALLAFAAANPLMAATNTLMAATNTLTTVKNPARITSNSTYYDRKEGMVIFNGNVFVDDAEYKLHADKAFIFLSETNDLKRIVAIGNVALTNGLKCAYGEKATFRRDTGVVVLHSGKRGPAEVRETTSEGDRVVRGKKIRLWINQEQVEVLEADITVPTGGVTPDMLLR